MNKHYWLVELPICIAFGLLIALVLYLAATVDEPSYAYHDVPWSASAQHRVNFRANPSLLA